MSSPKTILFLGATGGVGLSALRRSLAANHTCIALCRTPSNLTSQLPESKTSSNLHIVQGDAHDQATLARCLVHPSDSTRLVDAIIFSIGARPTLRGMSDAHVCENGMTALLAALRQQQQSIQGGSSSSSSSSKPRLVAVSTTGISDVARDVPLAFIPLYKVALHTPHQDKKKMEQLVTAASDCADWTIVRGSLYTSGPETQGKVRAGKEDPVRGVLEKEALGYTISREDVGKWVFEECVQGGSEWVGKAAIITY